MDTVEQLVKWIDEVRTWTASDDVKTEAIAKYEQRIKELTGGVPRQLIGEANFVIPVPKASGG